MLKGQEEQKEEGSVTRAQGAAIPPGLEHRDLHSLSRYFLQLLMLQKLLLLPERS